MNWLLGLCVVIGIAASVEDLWRRRVSNVIALSAWASGLLVQSMLYGLNGTWDSLLGSFFGFAVFLVFYLLGGMGGGDIKLMAGFGAIIGREQIWLAAFLTALVGGAIALAYLLVKKVAQRVRRRHAETVERSRAKDAIPYAPAISLGVLLSFLSEDGLWTSVS